MTPPVLFSFGVHIHQPVGNFDDVFREHVDDVYLPFLQSLEERALFPFTLHVSGPLLEWMEAHDTRLLERVGRLVADGHVELLASGYYEPVLAALTSADRVEQIQWMRAELERLFGFDARGLWLTERVWEPDLTADLARAGVRFALVDDHHFLVTGFERSALHAPHWAEHDGRRVALFPIDERLRYLVPFRPPEELAAYLRRLGESGHGLAVLADDGEKFGGWPGTAEWLYDQGWLASFFDVMDGLLESGTVEMTTLAGALERVPAAGPVHLHTASYREMEGWALPTPAALRMRDLTRELGEVVAGPAGALVRGSHWKNFLVKYREANRMQQKALGLSALCRERGDPPGARRAVGRAQCNDAYWHGVFGGLYLKHLRDAVWRNLAEAEAILREGEGLAVEPVDLDGDGAPELLVHSARFSAVVNPARGGAMEEYTGFEAGINFANALTRRREVYHYPVEGTASGAPAESAPAHETDAPADAYEEARDGAPSIHDIEGTLAAATLPEVDDHDRALFVERVVIPTRPDAAGPGVGSGGHTLRTWALTPLRPDRIRVDDGRAHVDLVSDDGSLEKAYRFEEDGRVEVTLRWSGDGLPDDATFVTELSFGDPCEHEAEPEPADVAVGPIETVSRTEEGLATTVQGQAVRYAWPAGLGRAVVRLRPRRAPPEAGAAE